MDVILAIVIGGLFAASVYSLLQRSLFRMVIGVVLLSQTANLIVFTAGGLTRGKAAFIADDATQLAEAAADPLPQALVLTAIVIGLGVTSFLLALLLKGVRKAQIDDLDKLNPL
ncbi:NADH-quinone oxidoreductase subunit K [Persicirhabdus sediminis]|uniref:NADH-quinone oxidoreductase subunit K n=1 Tax=Persicirhabdus sediminis TaxID=454144 RepID=A0A8J7M9Y2_9BACT|nr:NADH-quinone oxidoreductase subunit K [Persicirhabdus sediminis]MBK1789602.1 NADH-quinone oxidoreductase subunit K [Persicirhabdus sediminis]